MIDALYEINGAYALVGIANDKLIGVRDPLGIRPLVLGKMNESYIFASETCALDIIGAKFVREVENGEVVVISAEGIKSYKPFPKKPERPCIFEYIYFARPDSIVGGKSIYECRKGFGRELAKESNVEADMVIPIPDSGVPSAIGYAEQASIPFELGITRNHYVGRTFIQPKQSIRSFGVRLKHNANRTLVAGKRIVLIDDSIVRGTTSVKIVQMMREAGAKRRFILGCHRRPSLIRIFTGSTHRAKISFWHQPKAWQRCASTSVQTASRSCQSRGSIRRLATKTEETPTVHNTRTTVSQVTIPHCWRTKAEGN